MLTAIAFLVAIAVLVAVHEWGHYAVARLCGVKVLRFSVGFGPKLMGWVSPTTKTEFVVSWIPLGGYVKMLDEREGEVADDQRAQAFNNQSVRARAAIAVAGPAANLILAVVLYAVVNWSGVVQAQAILAKPPAQSVLAEAGFSGGEHILRAGLQGDGLTDLASYEDFRWWVARGALERRNLDVEFSAPHVRNTQAALIMLDRVDTSLADVQMFQHIGVLGPFSRARLGNLMPDGAASASGLMTGDIVVRVDETEISDAAQLRQLIQLSGKTGVVRTQQWSIDRDGRRMTFEVTPKLVTQGNGTIGRVGAIVGEPPATSLVQYGFFEGLGRASSRTWEISALSLRMMGQIVIGDASIKNLSGPVTIADYAGKSAALGWTQFVLFLALMSVSLGVLNLLPVPMLDGGHLMYYLWEALSGKPVSQLWAEWLQKIGLVLLLAMMSVAVANDLTRWLP